MANRADPPLGRNLTWSDRIRCGRHRYGMAMAPTAYSRRVKGTVADRAQHMHYPQYPHSCSHTSSPLTEIRRSSLKRRGRKPEPAVTNSR
jgi:hypothetical protein